MNRSRIALVGVDADDTLWHNETIYREAEEMFCDVLDAASGDDVRALRQELLAIETGNVPLYGYGIKSFVLSMIETVARREGDVVPTNRLQDLLGIARWMIEHEVSLLDGVAPTLRTLQREYQLALITKGDVLDQRRKLSRSGVSDVFDRIEVVSEKDERVYREILLRCGVPPERFVMIGNSLKSDVLPVVAIGAAAIHIPYPHEWEHETVSRRVDEPGRQRWISTDRFGDVPALLRSIDANRCRGA